MQNNKSLVFAAPQHKQKHTQTHSTVFQLVAKCKASLDICVGSTAKSVDLLCGCCVNVDVVVVVVFDQNKQSF
jgi:hypothetical protein